MSCNLNPAIWDSAGHSILFFLYSWVFSAVAGFLLRVSWVKIILKILPTTYNSIGIARD